MFVIRNPDGDDLATHHTLDEAIAKAKADLEDDPERHSELEIWELDENEAFAYHVRTVTFVPDEYWESVVGVLSPGEKIQPPGPIPHRITEEDLEGYDLGDPKRAALEQRIGEWT
jgi:hypothetical protein